jgi:predicted ATPase
MADLRTIVTTASGAGSGVALKEIYLSGEAGSSSYGRVVVNGGPAHYRYYGVGCW